MPLPPDRVQIIKQESTSLGGNSTDEFPFDVPIEPEEDALEAAGYYVQASGLRDENVLIFRQGDDMMFQDLNNPIPVTLTELLAGSGVQVSGFLTATQHKSLRQLIHFLDEGPGDGFTTTAFKQVVGQPFPTSIIWYEDIGQTKKIFEKLIERSAGPATNVKPTPITHRVYDTDGTTVLATATDDITYSGVNEVARVRTFTV